MSYKIAFEQLSEVTLNYKNAIFNSVAIAFTSGFGKLTSYLTFRCPCVDPKALPKTCLNAADYRDFACMNSTNFAYGLSFVVAPAIAFFVLGLLLKQKLWKALTGHRYKAPTETHEKRKFCETVLGMAFKSLIYPATWISLALLDGQFLACALTAVPYDLKNSYKNCWTVSHTNEPLTSSSYDANRRFSQTLGLILIACFVLIAFTVYVCNNYHSRLTFYHAQYYKEIKHDEEIELRRQIMQAAAAEAAENVTQFLSKKKEEKTKELWDKVSSVYDSPTDSDYLQHLTNLQEWVNCGRCENNCIQTSIPDDKSKQESFEMNDF